MGVNLNVPIERDQSRGSRLRLCDSDLPAAAGGRVANGVSIALLGQHTIVREALRQVLEDADLHVHHSAATIDAVEPSGDEMVEIVLILADEWSTDMVARVGQRFPAAQIVLLADEFDFTQLRAAFDAGVAGYLVRQISIERLLGSLRLVALGEKVFPSQLAAELIRRTNPEGHDGLRSGVESAHLSGRELEVLRGLMMGLSNKVVSRRLSICEATVKVHVKAVLRKLNVTNRTQAAIWADSHALEELDRDEAGVGQGPTSSRPAAPAMPLLPGLLDTSRALRTSS